MVARFFALLFTSAQISHLKTSCHQYVSMWQTDVANMLSDCGARASHIIWRTLMDRVTHHYRDKGVTEEEHLLAFARDKGPAAAFVHELSTTGFSFGSKGEHIIGHALEAMFHTSTVPLDAIRPLDLKKFTHFFLIPYIATLAIVHRLDVSTAEAHTILLESRLAGIQLHPALDSDEELDRICRSNIQRSKLNTIVIRPSCMTRNEAQGGPPRFHSRTWRIEVLSLDLTGIY
ncbi:hypothetical protein F4604DRAFT_96074 [Suillus subluteus]|nr:hypothetical protein F4604DRAFT_96074 [Suillus subluteus]